MGACLGPYAQVPGGPQQRAVAEFNLNGDVTAAAICLGLPVPLRIAPFDVTSPVFFSDADRAAITVGAGELGVTLDAQMTEWCDVLRSFSDDPDVAKVRLHDPLTVVGIAMPELERTEELHLSLHGAPGKAFLVESAHGRRTTVVRAFDGDALRQELVETITG
jgi:inosine-uridine nucleoside N-ribohydrolase